LKGLFHRKPWHAAMIAIAMLSLAGLPALPRLHRQVPHLQERDRGGYTLYAVLGLVGSYLGIYFYLRVVQFLFMSPAEAGATAERRRAHRRARGAVPRRRNRVCDPAGLGAGNSVGGSAMYNDPVRKIMRKGKL
jgi:NADH-quinone oxidoreductase subunit N